MYQFISDDGHGWLGVPSDALRGIGDRITVFSYYEPDTGTVWLEEDCDVATFIRAVAPGIERQWWADNVRETSVCGDAWIRRLSPWEPSRHSPHGNDSRGARP